MAPMGTFCFVMLTLRNPPVEVREIIGIYVTQMVLSNARLSFGGPSPVFMVFMGEREEQKTSILGNIFNKVRNWWLTIPQLGGIWKTKNISVNYWIYDYIHASIPPLSFFTGWIPFLLQTNSVKARKAYLEHKFW